MARAILRKKERICNFRLIEQLFGQSKKKAFSAFPIRLIYTPTDDGNKILVSVPKRHFKHAVDRNRIKRQIREAYRKNKDLIAEKSYAMAFIWMASEMLLTRDVEQKVIRLLQTLADS